MRAVYCPPCAAAARPQTRCRRQVRLPLRTARPKPPHLAVARTEPEPSATTRSHRGWAATRGRQAKERALASRPHLVRSDRQSSSRDRQYRRGQEAIERPRHCSRPGRDHLNGRSTRDRRRAAGHRLPGADAYAAGAAPPGITAFGTNAWTAAKVGDRLMPEHEEGPGSEEVYVVLRGHARFEVDGESVDAPSGTLVFVEPETNRTAFAVGPDTAVIAVGSKVGKPYEVGGWRCGPSSILVRRGRLRRRDRPWPRDP